MRIIAGKYKRTPLLSPEGSDVTRPTRDMVKEALFSSIDVEGGEVLDLFSGSGAIGLEALSRGAKDAVFNDVNSEACSLIRANLAKVHENREVLNLNFDLCLKRLSGRSFDFIYLDPPYAFSHFGYLFSLIREYGLLKENGRIVAEVRKNTDLAEQMSGYFLYKEKRYGINKLLYYREETE